MTSDQSLSCFLKGRIPVPYFDGVALYWTGVTSSNSAAADLFRLWESNAAFKRSSHFMVCFKADGRFSAMTIQGMRVPILISICLSWFFRPQSIAKVYFHQNKFGIKHAWTCNELASIFLAKTDKTTTCRRCHRSQVCQATMNCRQAV